jgi:hypothetical protein
LKKQFLERYEIGKEKEVVKSIRAEVASASASDGL